MYSTLYFSDWVDLWWSCVDLRLRASRNIDKCYLDSDVQCNDFYLNMPKISSIYDVIVYDKQTEKEFPTFHGG